jgi:hypothetical protein
MWMGLLTNRQTKKLAVRGQPYRLNVFDTVSICPLCECMSIKLSDVQYKAGQERFRTLSTSYYRGAHGVILVYDISSRASFLSMGKWIEEARTNAAPDAALYLVILQSHSQMQKPKTNMVDLGWEQVRQGRNRWSRSFH